MEKEYHEPCPKNCLSHRYHCAKCNTACSFSPANYASRPTDILNPCNLCFPHQDTPQGRTERPLPTQADTDSRGEPKEQGWEVELASWWNEYCGKNKMLPLLGDVIPVFRNLLAKERQNIKEKIAGMKIESVRQLKPRPEHRYQAYNSALKDVLDSI